MLMSMLVPFALSTALAQDPPVPPKAPIAAEDLEKFAPPTPPTPPTPPATPNLERPPIIYKFDQRAVINDQEINDLFVFAQETRVATGVHDNAFVFSQAMTIEEGQVIEGDLFAFAQRVDIRGTVEGDVYAMAADFYVHPDARIGGDVIFGSANVNVEGAIEGDFQGAAGNALLDGDFGGHVLLDAGNLVIGNDTRIAGDLRYGSEIETVIPAGANIAGDVKFTKQVIKIEVEEVEEEEPGLLSGLFFGLIWKGWMYAASLMVGFLGLFLGGAAAARPGRVLKENLAPVIGVGFVVFCMVPVLSTMAVVTIIPMPLGVIGFMLYAVGIYVARLVAGQALGDIILSVAMPDKVPTPYLSLAVGVAVLAIAISIPYLGTLVWLGAVIAGFGGLAMAIRDGRKAK